MLRRWVVAACAREWGHALDRSDFEVLQRAVLPAFAPLLRKHPGDPKCKTTELCFLLRAGWVVVRPLRGRGCSCCAPAGGARAKCGPWGGLHRDFCRHPSHLCPYSSRFLFFFLAPFDVRPGPGYAWPRRGSWVPTLIRGLPSRGTPAKKNWPRSEKPCRWAWPLLQPGGTQGAFFPNPPLQGGLVN